MRWIKVFFVNLLIFLLLLELVSFVMTKAKLLPVSEEPPYKIQAPTGLAWRTEQESWGAWHKIHSVDRHRRPCFDVGYQSNDIGARDDIDYLPLTEGDSIILLGDSFAEGYGVEMVDIFAKRLSRKLGRNVLNFGASGDFGPVQEYLLYEELVSKIPHDEVILFFLPANDFVDNSLSYGAQRFGARHRPYFVKGADDSGFTIEYPLNSVPSTNFPSHRGISLSFAQKLYLSARVLLVRFTYTANVVRSITQLWRSRRLKPSDTSELQRATGYFADDAEAIEGSLYFVEKLMNAIPAQYSKTVVIIPSKDDIEEIREHGWAYEELDWFRGLRAIARDHNARLIDLAKTFGEQRDMTWLADGAENWYLKCDGHWSAEGNKMATERFLETKSDE